MALGARRYDRQSPEAANEIAIAALGALAADEERLAGFLAQAGIGPDNLREAAKSAGFVEAVLQYVCSDDAFLMEVSSKIGRKPEEIDMARQILGGPAFDWGA